MHYFQTSLMPVEGLRVSNQEEGASMDIWINKWTLSRIKAGSCSMKVKRILFGHQEATQGRKKRFQTARRSQAIKKCEARHFWNASKA